MGRPPSFYKFVIEDTCVIPSYNENRAVTCHMQQPCFRVFADRFTVLQNYEPPSVYSLL